MSFESWWNELRLAARALARASSFSTAAVLTLAVGVAGTTTVFALVHGVLLRPLPVREQARLIVGWKEFPSGSFAHWPFRSREIDAIGRESRLLESVSGVSYYGAGGGVVFESGQASSLRSASVMGGFFGVAGAVPVLGRALRPADDVKGAENVLVISHGLWQRRYAGARDAIGRRLTIGDQPFTIVGVMPADFEYPRGAEAWMTLAADASKTMNPAFREGVLRDVDLVARLRPGATLEEARSELARLVTALETDLGPDAVRGLRPVVKGYREAVVGEVRPALVVVFAAVGLVLLIASANVANLMLVRGESRKQELAVRAALGAGTGRLARHLAAECLVLAAAAGVVGLAASRWLLQAVVALVPGGLPRVESVRLDAAVGGFTLAVTFLAAAIAAVAPAVAASRTDLSSQLREGRQVGGGRGARRGRRALVVAQVALALPIVAAAGLLARSLLHLQTADMGMAAGRLLFVDLGPAATKQPDRAREMAQFLDDVVARLEAIPGIEGATAVNTPPFAGSGGWDAPHFTAEGQGFEQVERNPVLNLESVLPNYFATFQVPLVRGRGFSVDDRKDSALVAIVSEDLARRTWPGGDGVGKRLKFGRPDSSEPWRTVVGVVKPTRYRELAEPRPTLYLPGSQFIMSPPALVLRTTLEPGLASEIARARVRAADPNMDVMRVTTFAELLAEPLARPRFNALLVGAFGVSALLLATVGVYAVVAAAVRQRYAEIGIRVALGATRADVYRLVVSEGLRLALFGAASGLIVTALATRLVRGLLHGVRPLDPPTLAVAVLLLVGAALVASWLPARRAVRIDPAAAVRTE